MHSKILVSASASRPKYWLDSAAQVENKSVARGRDQKVEAEA